MNVIVGPHKASPELLAPLADLISRSAPSIEREGATREYHYIIDYVQKSESAWILFVHSEKDEKERYVIKLLCNYNDQRYQLETLARRQSCQLEALACNSLFSPDIYIGLASAYELQAEALRIAISSPTQNKTLLHSSTEYALVMHTLPVESRLDLLLEHGDEKKLSNSISQLIGRIVHIHTTSPALPPNEIRRWGSAANLEEKLRHNLSLADPLLKTSSYSLQLWRRFKNLQDSLLDIFTLYAKTDYFEQRISQKHIKHCHGDLKGPNIWIEQQGSQETYRVAILDAIDFNPMYSNIDILSDFATLAVDIQTRLHCSSFACELVQGMIKEYLLSIGQYDNLAARELLHYYMIEKAFVGAAISIVYDDLPELGELFLQAAETCRNAYFRQWPPLPRIETSPAPPGEMPVLV